MSHHISWNLQLAVREGQLEAVKPLMEEMVTSTRKEMGTMIYEWFLSADGTECHLYERYLDNEAALIHAGIFVSQFAERFFTVFEQKSLSLYGEASEELTAAMTQAGADFYPSLGGFSR